MCCRARPPGLTPLDCCRKRRLAHCRDDFARPFFHLFSLWLSDHLERPGGTSAGGPLAPYTSVLGPMLQHPSDPGVTYSWVDAYDAMPAEVTPIASLAHAWVDGRTNFAEWQPEQ